MEIEKSDSHYREIEENGTIEPIVIMEQLAERMIKNEVPADAIANIILAQKHITRGGNKAGEDWRKEIQKSINYLTRAVTGKWIQ